MMSTALSCEMLLHPELLSNEQLVFIIQERHLRVPDLHAMARHELLEIFHQFCVPYGQRKYRDSGRGKILNKVRNISPERVVKLNTCINNQSRKTLHSETFERLKAPPDLLSGHMKRIKLDTKSAAANHETCLSKRKMSIDVVSPEIDPPRKKERKLISWP